MDFCSILGIPVSCLNAQQAADAMIKILEEKKERKDPCYFATVNMDFLSNAFYPKKEPLWGTELFDLLRTADFVTADGAPILWLAKALQQPLAERVTGADLFLPLCSLAEKKEFSIYLLGGHEATTKKNLSILQHSFASLRIAGWSCPMITLEKTAVASQGDAKIIEKINQAQPDLLFLFLGNPKQELWFARNRHLLKTRAAIGLGGTMNFLVGKTSRAPEWMQKAGLEWAWRLFDQPKRLAKRYFFNALHLPKLFLPPIWCTATSKKTPCPYTVLLKDKDQTPLLQIITPKSALLSTDCPSLLDLRGFHSLSGKQASSIVSYCKKYQKPLRYLGNTPLIYSIIKAHKLHRWISPISNKDFQQTLHSLPSRLWIDLPPTTKTERIISSLLVPLQQKSKQLFLANITEKQKVALQSIMGSNTSFSSLSFL